MCLIIGLVSCSSEDTDVRPNQKRIPEWAEGEYMGVHTGKPLMIESNKVQFQIEQTSYEFFANEFTDVIIEENKVLLFTESDILVFSKTTLDSEINFKFNELYLGWFRKTVVQ